MNAHICRGLGIFFLAASASFGEPIMAPVIYKTGVVTATAPGPGMIRPQQGGSLAEKTSLKSNPASQIAFAPFPGGSVLVLENSETSLQSMEFERSGEQVAKRGATLRLDAGRLFYSIEKFKTDVTKFAVITPDRVVAARPKGVKPDGMSVAGLVEVHGRSLVVTIVSGSADLIAPDGASISVNEGAVFTATEGTAQVVNLVSGKATYYDATGKAGEGPATALELAAARVSFQASIGIAEQAITTASLGGSLVAAMTRTVIEVNRELSSKGIDAISTTAIGTTTAPRAVVVAPLVRLPGMESAGTANPANISGVVRSGER